MQERDMNGPLAIILAVCAFIGLGIALKQLVRWIGFPCQFCDKKVK